MFVSMKSHMHSRALALVGLVAGFCIITSAAYAKSRWASELDLEPSLLRSVALVMAVDAVSHGGSVEDYVSIIDSLRAVGATVEPAGEISQPFFPVKGRVITVNDAGVQVFEFVNVYDANAEAVRVSVDGSFVGETHLNWVAPPHFFKNGKLIVLYVGDDSTLMNLLQAVLGRQFAGR